MARKLKWKPVFSFFCILASLFFILAIVNPIIAVAFIGFVITYLTAFAQLFTDHYNNVKGLWFNKILPETHTFFIWMFAIVSVGMIMYLFNNYRLSFEIKKVGDE